MTRAQYIKAFTQAVLDSTKGSGLFPSLVMAQAILESSDKNGQAGNSLLAKQFNNHFGIKADKAWKGKSINLKTGEVIQGESVVIKDAFRVYDHPEHSFKDRTTFLISNPRYYKAGVFRAPTPEAQAEALQNAGYATDPTYAAKLKTLIQVHDLKLLDELAKKTAYEIWDRLIDS